MHMNGLRYFKSISSSLALALVALAAQADEACETFIGDTLEKMFSSIDHMPQQNNSELRNLVEANVDTLSIARFTLGKYASSVTAEDLNEYALALNAFFLDDVRQHLSVDIIKSFDRNHRDCIVETIIHRETLEDLSVVWRVMRVGELHQVLDVALEQNGNTVWLAIELRAQVIDLFERSNGDLDVVIRQLGIG